MSKIFSIIVPAHNAETTIERTLASFLSNKDFINEIIVVNDRCTDNTLTIARSYLNLLPIQIIDTDGAEGPGPARKTGLLYAKSDWLTFVDADDCLTPSSLRYVYNTIQEQIDAVLLHAKTIYYEFGTFNADDIGYSDYSCGGNFYKTEYLIQNQLFPHDTLRMAEDEYFNNKIEKFIKYCDKSDNNITYFDYPVYEVHHDEDKKSSFAHSNWTDYIIKYHLLAQQYLTEDYKDVLIMQTDLFKEYINNFIFAYFALQALKEDVEINLNIDEQKRYFKKSLDYFKETFSTSASYLINYYNNNSEDIDNIYEGAKISTGSEQIDVGSFQKFVDSL